MDVLRVWDEGARGGEGRAEGEAGVRSWMTRAEGRSGGVVVSGGGSVMGVLIMSIRLWISNEVNQELPDGLGGLSIFG